MSIHKEQNALTSFFPNDDFLALGYQAQSYQLGQLAQKMYLDCLRCLCVQKSDVLWSVRLTLEKSTSNSAQSLICRARADHECRSPPHLRNHLCKRRSESFIVSEQYNSSRVGWYLFSPSVFSSFLLLLVPHRFSLLHRHTILPERL